MGITASYSGDMVDQGYLAGNISDDKLCFKIVQIDKSGNLDGGYSTCDIKRSALGKIQLIEHFKWESREGSGTNIFEEINCNYS